MTGKQEGDGNYMNPLKPIKPDQSAPPDNPRPLLSASAEGATLLILLQIGSRGLTFALNQILLRYLSPELLGISAQLELYSISVLYFARESIRIAAQRQHAPLADTPDVNKASSAVLDSAGKLDGDSASGKTQSVVNVSHIAVILGIPFAFCFGSLYYISDGAVVHTSYFKESLQLYALAAAMELLTEPCFLTIQHLLLYKLRAFAEAAATFTRCVVTCGTAIQAARRGMDVGPIPFAIGQMSYAIVLALVYYAGLWKVTSTGGFTLKPRRLFSRRGTHYIFSCFSEPILDLAASVFIQSGVKHVLTYGDSLLINALASLHEQGAYAIAGNYGGLIARMVFQPIEESSRNLFSKLLAANESEEPELSSVQSAGRILSDILRLYSLVSLFAVAFGPTLAPLLLKIVAGERWSSTSAVTVLSTYCYYIPLLAMNGVTEAFISSVANTTQLRRQAGWMFAFSTGFAVAGYVFLRVLQLGAQGLVWANVVNMLLRIIWSMNFIRTYLAKRGGSVYLSDIVPTTGSISVSVAAGAMIGALAIPFVLLIVTFERGYMIRCYTILRSGRVTPRPKEQ